MTPSISEFTSHKYPEVTRVQYEGVFSIIAGFVFFEDGPEIGLNSIWYLIDEAVTQNARFFRPKPTRLFSFDFDNDSGFKCYEVIPSSEQEVSVHPRLFPPKTLAKAANEIANRRRLAANEQQAATS